MFFTIERKTIFSRIVFIFIAFAFLLSNSDLAEARHKAYDKHKEVEAEEAAEPIYPDLGLTASAAIVIDAEDGSVLYEKNADVQLYPASLTKMMTCILALELGNRDDIVTISRDAQNVESTFLHTGVQVRLFDLIQQMMLVSDNAAATALAEYIAGSQQAFADLMNAKALKIGTTNTYFINANGMPHRFQVSSARDMALIAQYGMKNRLFRNRVGTQCKYITWLYPETTIDFWNTNELLYVDPTVTGIKTGYTSAAGYCLAASAERNGRELIAVVMHSRDYDSRFNECAALFDYCFGNISSGN